ncbi:hypothetical protein LCGC14_1106770 [marine sediment metagenome]|uniref:Uncharacterized protein n=1 Tax=marine sediment metagenome TaxID=412755 RepID=A0A0F9PR45_9ZZZZ
MNILIFIGSILFLLSMTMYFYFGDRSLTPKGFWVDLLMVIMLIASGILLALGVNKLL